MLTQLVDGRLVTPLVFSPAMHGFMVSGKPKLGFTINKDMDQL